MKRHLLSAILLMALLPSGVFAGPNYLTHQGRIIASNNTPVAGAESLTFALYAAAEGGSALWSETLDVVFDDGYYTVILGADNELPDDIFNGTTRYLGVTLDNNSEMAPRLQVNSVPYALVAGQVSGPVNAVGGLSVNGNTVIDPDGSWAGDMTVQGNLEIQGNLQVPTSSSDCIEQLAGALRWNTDDGILEFCDGTDWAAVSALTPEPTDLDISQGSQLGGFQVVITGSSFQHGCLVKFGTTDATAVQFDNATQLTVTVPELEPGVYNIMVSNPSGKAATMQGVWTSRADSAPQWQTEAGSLVSLREDRTDFSVVLEATDDDGDDITYSLISGAVPDGMTFDETNAEISGDPTDVDDEEVSTFTVRASSTYTEVTQYEDREFTITIRNSANLVFDYTGSDQSWTVPEGVTSIYVKMWGAGGGGGNVGGWNYGANAGGGGYAGGELTITPGESLTFIVGKGGIKGSETVTGWHYGGGACHRGCTGNRYGGCGGGRSEIRRDSTSLIIAGGGGGGGSSRAGVNNFGGAGGGTDGQRGNAGYQGSHPGGGTQSAGGSGGSGSSNGEAGTQYQGGRSASACYGGGGGGGWYGGGGGGYTETNGMSGGGGGSSYIVEITDGVTTSGDWTTPGNAGDEDRNGAGSTCGINCTGSNGIIVVVY